MSNDVEHNPHRSSALVNDGTAQPPVFTVLQKLKQHARALVISVLGIVSAAIIPLWQIYFVQTSDVMIEVASISREKSSDFMVQLDTDELLLLAPYIPEALLYEYNHLGQRGDKIEYPEFSMHTLFLAYEKAKQDLKNIAITKANLQRHIARIDAYLDPENREFVLVEFRVKELKGWDLSNYIEDAEAAFYEKQLLAITRSYLQMKFRDQHAEPEINQAALIYLLKDVREDIEEVIHESNMRHGKLRDNIRNIESQLYKLSEQQRNQHTFFTVEVVASNTGRVSTSLRPLALMRVQISDTNYVDIRLQLQDYTERAELQPSSTNILHFHSAEIRDFPKEDQTLINTFWGSTGRVRLYAIDTKHNIFASNPIAFADNRNQKLIVDKLKESAAAGMR